MELKEKEEKDQNHRGKLYRKNPRKKVPINSRLKAIYIIGQRKAFCGQRIPESSCARKGTVDIEIPITSRRKGDRKIMQPIKITSETATRMRKWNQLLFYRYLVKTTLRQVCFTLNKYKSNFLKGEFQWLPHPSTYLTSRKASLYKVKFPNSLTCFLVFVTSFQRNTRILP